MKALLTIGDLRSLEVKIRSIEAYMASDEFRMLRESTRVDYLDWLNGMRLRYSYYKFSYHKV